MGEEFDLEREGAGGDEAEEEGGEEVYLLAGEVTFYGRCFSTLGHDLWLACQIRHGRRKRRRREGNAFSLGHAGLTNVMKMVLSFCVIMYIYCLLDFTHTFIHSVSKWSKWSPVLSFCVKNIYCLLEFVRCVQNARPWNMRHVFSLQAPPPPPPPPPASKASPPATLMSSAISLHPTGCY